MLDEIYKRLNINREIENERNKFLNRVKGILDETNNAIYSICASQTEEKLRFDISYVMGLPRTYPNLKDFIDREKFEENLANIEIILNTIKSFNSLGDDWDYFYETIEEGIKRSLIFSIDIGYYFKNGRFYISGGKELDKKLISDVLIWLNDFPNTKKLFQSALNKYIAKDYSGTITDAYSALEGIVKTFLSNKKTLENNKEELIKKLKISKEWGRILHSLCFIANEFSTRHGKEEGKLTSVHSRHVEHYLYQIGLTIRLIIGEIKNTKK